MLHRFTLPWLLLMCVPAQAFLLGDMKTRLGVTRIAAGAEGDHTCHVVADGTVRCWGENAKGQIGDGSSGNLRTTPTVVTGLFMAVSIAAGQEHSCALLATGNVRCWGSNTNGQLGTGAGTPDSAVPVTVPGLAGVTSLTAGSAHNCARLSNGTVRCWGLNANGQLGDDTVVSPRFTPVAVAGLLDAATVSAGANHSCVLRGGGVIACWGSNTNGQLGIGTTANRRTTPTNIASGDAFTQVSAGDRFTCARRGNGAQLCWGRNQFGQLGNGSAGADALVPTEVGGADEPQRRPAIGVWTGGGHACALGIDESSDFALNCWGENASGELGRPVSAFEPLPLISGGNSMAIALGRNHSCRIRVNDAVTCSGANGSGQLGNGSTTASTTQVTALGLAGSISARGITAGTNHSCAWRASGGGSCWGRNGGAALGDGTFTDRLVPTTVAIFGNLLGMAAGGNHTGAYELDFSIPTFWGDNRDGQGRPGSVEDFILTSVNSRSSSGLLGGVQISAGSFHSCELSMRGAVHCRGRNLQGQLGGTPPAGARSFGPVGNLADVVDIAAGNGHTCALRANGRVACWGLNTFGQLGDGTTNSGTAVREATGIVNAIAIGVGRDHSCALLATGVLSCWGRNDTGQVDGTTNLRLTPVVVNSVPVGDAIAFSGGFQHSCYLRSSGGVRCWGRNDLGQLGNNSLNDSTTPVDLVRATLFVGSTPVRFATVVDAIGLDAGSAHSCALRVGGVPVCWGRNPEGQLGNGSRSDSRSAIGPGSFSANVAARGSLAADPRFATVTGLVNCPPGERYSLAISLAQGKLNGRTEVEGDCSGGLALHAMQIESRGPRPFRAGAASARADIVVHGAEGDTDIQHWTRQIQLDTQ